MPRSTLPKAYLRIDPNIDRAKADTQWAFIRLLCEANRQPRRGVFKTRRIFDVSIGKTSARRLMAAGDAVEMADGTVVVPGWEEWQEGDVTVGERMRRMRERRDSTSQQRNGSVTEPYHPAPITTTSTGTDRGVGEGRRASADGADPPTLSPIEDALSRLMRRSPAPRQLSAVEDFDAELPDGVAVSVIEDLIDERPERNVFGALLDELRKAKAQTKPSNGVPGPKRRRLNDYDSLAEGASG